MSGYLTHDEAELRNVAAAAVERAIARGAGASATVHHDGSGKIVFREGEVETAERNVRQSLRITVHVEGRHGSASTAALDRDSVARAVDEAFLIANELQPEPDADLPPTEWLAFDGPSPELYSPDVADASVLLDTASAIHDAATQFAAPDGVSLRISEAAAAAGEGIWALATSNGFCRSGRYSINSRWCMALAQDSNGTISDYQQSRDRRADALAGPETIARDAIERALAAIGPRSISSRRTPVLFDARIAHVLVDELVGALSGMAQVRKSSFLRDPLDRPIAAGHLDLDEDPFEPFGLASGGFDSEGIAGSRRTIIDGGVARGLFLGTFSGRKLGMQSTGNAEGPYNLRLTSRAAGGNRAAMLARLGTGLLVTGIQGGGTDPVTGNWTRAVKGFWVENGSVVHPIEDVTVAGSLPEMLMGVAAVGEDVERQGAIRTGSILVEEMQLGGRA